MVHRVEQQSSLFRESNTNKPSKAASSKKSSMLIFNDMKQLDTKETAYYHDLKRSNLQIPAGTVIETDSGILAVDDNGQAWLFNRNTRTWKKTESLEYMATAASKVLASIADNYSETSGNMSLSKKDLDFKTNPKEDLVSRFYGGYDVAEFKKDKSSIYVELSSDTYGRISDKSIKISFDVPQEKLNNMMKMSQYSDLGIDSAHKVYDQISGPSLNKNTFKVLNDLSDNELLAAIDQYNNRHIYLSTDKNHHWVDGKNEYTYVENYHTEGMFEDLNDEWGIGVKELMPVIDRAYKIIPEYLRKGDSYKELTDLLGTIDRNSDEDFDRRTIQKIDKLFGAVLDLNK